MQVWDFASYEFTDENFIKDYRKTAAILDEDTRKTIKRMNEIASQT